MKKKSIIQIAKRLLIGLSLFFIHNAYAVDVLPSSVEPGVVSRQLSAPSIEPQQFGPSKVKHEEEKPPSPLGPQAALIKFKLQKITLEGNHVYSTRELSKLYQDKLGKVISVAQLEEIVQSITNYYRNNGYILSRAILPPQHVANGAVTIRVIEGYIANVTVQGTPQNSRCIIQAYGNKIKRSRPLKLSVMEYYLRLANEIPGTSVRAVLEPSKTNVGASDVALVVEHKTFEGYISYDNYGTLYLGPNQVTGSVSANSLYQSGDATRLTMIRTTRPQELKYVDLFHEFPIGTNGMRGAFDINDARTMPGLNLAPLKIDGDATTSYASVQYPLIRAQDQDLTLIGSANYIDSGTRSFSFQLYDDHIRTLKGGANYDFADRFKGSNSMGLFIEQGIPVAGASQNSNSLTVSRFGADGIFTKFDGSAGRVQQLFGRFSAFIYLTGQYSCQPLLASEQFPFGGPQLGRGYDPAEIIGDQGLAGTFELRMDNPVGFPLFQSYEPYAFYDAGAIWNRKNVIGVKQKQSATSLGGGVRFYLSKNFSANLMIAQPLTKQIQSWEVIGQGRQPRGYFSITASV